MQYACQSTTGSGDKQPVSDHDSLKTDLPDIKPSTYDGYSHQDSMNAGLLVSDESYNIDDKSCSYIADIDTIVSPDDFLKEYEPDKGSDHWPASWWTPKQHRDGIGATYEIRFPQTIPVCAIELYGGAADHDYMEEEVPPHYTDLYHLNNRIKSGTLEFSDGTRVPFTRDDEQHWITIDIPENISSTYVRLTVTEVYNGSKWNDLALGDIQVLTNSEEFGYILDGIAKPVIYLYPVKTDTINVWVGLHGKLGTTWPAYDDLRGWQVIAQPDGMLKETGTGRQHRYLFWEGQAAGKWNMQAGFCIPGNQTAIFLSSTLEKLGLTDTEANDFISYWLPMMEDNPYNLIHFAGTEYTDLAPLSITPAPETTIRIFMVWKSSDYHIPIEPQTLVHMNRKGFCVVEWGGCRLPNKDLLSGN